MTVKTSPAAARLRRMIFAAAERSDAAASTETIARKHRAARQPSASGRLQLLDAQGTGDFLGDLRKFKRAQASDQKHCGQ